MYSTPGRASNNEKRNVTEKKSEPEDQGWPKTATQNLVIRKGTVPGNLRDYTTFFSEVYIFL